MEKTKPLARCEDCDTSAENRKIHAVMVNENEEEATADIALLCSGCLRKRDDEEVRRKGGRKPLEDFPDYYLTVGELRDRLEGIPDSTPVCQERIEDKYFDKENGWRTRKMRDVICNFNDIQGEYIDVFNCFWHPDYDVLIISPHY